jgi:hypothetical protein
VWEPLALDLPLYKIKLQAIFTEMTSKQAVLCSYSILRRSVFTCGTFTPAVQAMFSSYVYVTVQCIFTVQALSNNLTVQAMFSSYLNILLVTVILILGYISYIWFYLEIVRLIQHFF